MEEALTRVNNVLSALMQSGINPWIFAATGNKSIYRKPNIEMWQVFMQNQSNIDASKSLFVGDAAGRPQDFLDTDLVFVNNIGCVFYTSEQIFPTNQINIPLSQTMFIFIGMPGSSKSIYYKQFLELSGCVHINRDISESSIDFRTGIQSR